MKKILLIDDSSFARRLIRRDLEAKGYTICGEVDNGKDGVEQYKQLRPDLVFCDLMMNEMDGMSCLRKIIETDPEAKVVICTSIGEPPFITDALEAGAKEFIKKPVEAGTLIGITERLIGKP